MFKQTQELPYFGIFKASTGEEFIAKVTEADMMSYTLSKPLCLIATPEGTQFAPFMMMIDPAKSVIMHKSNVVCTGTPQGNILKAYEEITSSIVRVAPGTVV